MSDETKTTALAIVPRAGAGMVLRTVDDHKQFAMACWAAGVLDEQDKTRAVAQAMVKVQYGAEVGLGPMSAIAGVHLIKGRPSLGAGIIASRIQAHPLFRFRQAELTNTRCLLVFSEREHEGAPWLEVGDSVYTWDDAKRALLTEKRQRDGGPNMWHKHPRSMLFARALTDGARRFCPIVFSGSVYTPEELSGGECFEADFVPVIEDARREPPPGREGQIIDCEMPDDEPPPAEPPVVSSPAELRMQALIIEAKKLPRTGKIVAALEAGVIQAAEGELPPGPAGALIDRAKTALTALGWVEPAEWLKARKLRQSAKRAEAKAAAAESEPGEPEDAPPAPTDPFAAVLAELHALAGHARADKGARASVGELIDRHDKGEVTIAEARDLRDSLARYVAAKTEESERLF